MTRKINFLLLIIGGMLAFSNHSLAASNDFISSANITVGGVSFGATTTDLIILSNSSAQEWSYNEGAFSVTNPDATNLFKVASNDLAVKAIKVLNSSSTIVACVKNSNPGTSFVSLPVTSGVYYVEPSDINLANVASYNSSCGAATCNSGYVVSGSGSSAVCAVQSSGGGGGGGGGGSLTPTVVTAIGGDSSPVSLTITSSQNGTLSQSLVNGLKAEIIVSAGAVSGATKISVTATDISPSLNPTQGVKINPIGGHVFNIRAVDGADKKVSSFTKSLEITLTVPGLPEKTDNLGVHFYNEVSKNWVLIPGALFDVKNSKVSFSVDHLTEFAILKINDVSQSVTPVVNKEEIKTTSLDYIKEVLSSERKLIKSVDKSLVSRLLGRILMQVETLGRAWYLSPVSMERYYLADGDSAFSALRKFGLGIKNSDINKIPVGIESRFEMLDSDKDGLPDKLEEAIGTDPFKSDSDGDGFSDSVELKSGHNPLGPSKLVYSQTFSNRLKGRILIQTESRGEAWYVNPVDSKRYYLANGEAAYQIMRYLSLGITDENIQKIPVNELK